MLHAFIRQTDSLVPKFDELVCMLGDCCGVYRTVGSCTKWLMGKSLHRMVIMRPPSVVKHSFYLNTNTSLHLKVSLLALFAFILFLARKAYF